MFAFLPLALFVGVMVMIIGSYVLASFQRLEKTEMRLLDLQILADENGARFERFPQGFATILRTQHLGLGWKDIETKNVMRFERPESTQYLFDHRLFQPNSTTRSGSYTGLLIEFHTQTFPTFKITQKDFLSWVNYSYIQPERLPRDFPKSLTVIAHEDQKSDAVKILRANPALNQLLLDSRFTKVFFRDQYVAIYFDGLYATDSDNFNKLLRKLRTLTLLQGEAGWSGISRPPADDVEFSIRMLKAEAG